MSQKNSAGRTVRLYLMALLFVLFLTAVPSCSEEPSISETEWASIATENAGRLSLPAEWRVISRDEAAERSPEAEIVFNVQQSLYAKPEGTPGDTEASLQVFSVWGSDSSGRVAALPPEILEQSGEDLIGGLIGGRYGDVRQLSRDTLNTDLDAISVTTWGADSSNARYKCVTLFHGEKMVLVLARYLPEFEAGWNSRFEALVGKWVASLELTPGPIPNLLMAEVPLPAAHVAVLPENSLEATQTPDIADASDTPSEPILTAVVRETPENNASGGFFSTYHGISIVLAIMALLVALIGKNIQKRRAKGRLSDFQEIVPVPITAEELQARPTFPAISAAEDSFPEDLPRSDIAAAVALEEDERDGEPAPDIETDTEADDVPSVRRGLGIRKFFSFICRTFRKTDEPVGGNDSASPAEEAHAEPVAAPVISDFLVAPLKNVLEVQTANEWVEPDDGLVPVIEQETPPDAFPGTEIPEKENEEEKKVALSETDKADTSHPFDLIRAEDMDFPPLSSTYDNPDHPSVWEETPAASATETLTEAIPEEAGFEKVYTLINQALDILESYKDVMPAARYYSNLPEAQATPPVSALRENMKNFAPNVKESPALTSTGDDTNEIPENADPYKLKWLYLCAFALMAMADITVSVLFAQVSSAELLLSRLRGTMLVLLGNNFLLMGASCALALAIRFAILRRPMLRGGLLLFVSALSVALGAGAFSLGMLSFLSVLPDMNFMRGCALMVSFYLSYRTLTYHHIDDAATDDDGEEEAQVFSEEQTEAPAVEQLPSDIPQIEKIPETQGNSVETSLRRSAEIFKELESAFGPSYVLDLLEDEVLKALQNKDDTALFLQSEDVAPDCLLLKICSGSLIDLMRSGRYHIGHGILSSEGQELLDLFRNIADRLLRSGYSTGEEILKDSELMQRCVREQG